MSNYTEKIYKEIPLTEKKMIKVLTSTRDEDQSLLVDIRQFRLYHDKDHKDDYIFRPTNKGIKFHYEHIPEIVDALMKIYNTLSTNSGND